MKRLRHSVWISPSPVYMESIGEHCGVVALIDAEDASALSTV